MGTVHEIKEQTGPYRFVVRNRYTGQLTEVTVDSDKIGLFCNDRTSRVLPEACPFFRLDPVSEAGFCTVHLTWPEICRDFGCWKYLVTDASGNVLGRVFPPRMLVSKDDRLNFFWDTHIARIRCYDDLKWENEMKAELTGAGYRVMQ